MQLEGPGNARIQVQQPFHGSQGYSSISRRALCLKRLPRGRLQGLEWWREQFAGTVIKKPLPSPGRQSPSYSVNLEVKEEIAKVEGKEVSSMTS